MNQTKTMQLRYPPKSYLSTNLDDDVPPWDFIPAVPVPDKIRKDKKRRDSWISSPSTVHHVWTAYEGVNPHHRISKLRKDGNGNPVHSSHALVADYDASQPLEKVKEFASTLPFVPNWLEHTIRHYWRFVWLLEEPLLFPSDPFCPHFLRTIDTIAFDVSPGMVDLIKKLGKRRNVYGFEWL